MNNDINDLQAQPLGLNTIIEQLKAVGKKLEASNADDSFKGGHNVFFAFAAELENTQQIIARSFARNLLACQALIVERDRLQAKLDEIVDLVEELKG